MVKQRWKKTGYGEKKALSLLQRFVENERQIENPSWLKRNKTFTNGRIK